MSVFQKATKKQSKLRATLFGPSGSGKTYTALRIATGMGGKVALMDTERASASKYSDRFNFDVCEVADRTIDGYCAIIKQAGEYDVLIIDSLSHAWQELLEHVEKLAQAKYRGNTWSAWSEGTPEQRRLIDCILDFPGHVIATMRSKTEWTTAKNENGKSAPVRVGLAPEQGKGIEYEFDLLLELTVEHVCNVLKDRTGKFQDKLIEMPGEEFGKQLVDWLAEGEPVTPKEPPVTDKPKLTAEEEHEKRVVGRYKAAQSAKPSDMHENDWLVIYCQAASDLLDLIEPRNALHEFTNGELKDLSLRHEEVIKKAIESAPKPLSEEDTKRNKTIASLSKYVSDYTPTGDDKVETAAKFQRLACGALGLETEVALNTLTLDQLMKLWKDRKGILQMAVAEWKSCI